jgi:glutamine cyclotransferase
MFAFFFFFIAAACSFSSSPSSSPEVTPSQGSLPPVVLYHIGIKRTFPHDRTAFTQGLVYEDGIFYEGLGLNGRSAIRKVRLEDGKVLQEKKLSSELFGEGIAVWKDKLFELTWQNQTGFVYEKKSFQLLRQFQYSWEGWGLTTDGDRLIMSDGTERLRFLDPATLKETGAISVSDRGRAVPQLNELEMVDGKIYANVWKTNNIVAIDPKTGAVTAWIDLEPAARAAAQEFSGVDVLNGIAYDPEGKRLFVTGKLWPRVFEIELIKD